MRWTMWSGASSRRRGRWPTPKNGCARSSNATSSVIEGVGAVTIVLEEMTALTPAHRRLITARKRAYLDFIRQTLQQLASEGKLRNINPTAGAFGMLGMILWISRWYRRDGKITPRKALNDYMEMTMHALIKTELKASGK